MAKDFNAQFCKEDFWAGVKSTTPMIIGAIPFGILFGTLAEPSGLSTLGALAMSVFVYAGSAQFIALGLMAAGAPLLVLVATTFIVNLRHALYSANLVPHVTHLSHTWRTVIGFGLVDETFAAVSQYINEKKKQGEENVDIRWFYLGSWLSMYGNWILCTGIGVVLGRLFPDMTHWGLDFAMVVTFIGMVVPWLTSSATWVAVVTSAVIAMTTVGLPHKLGLLVAALCGIAVGFGYQRTGITLFLRKKKLWRKRKSSPYKKVG